MTTYHVILNATGQRVYEYRADAPISFGGMGFTTHDHVAQPDAEAPAPTVPVGRIMTKLEYLRLLTQAERVAIRTVAKTNAVLEDYLELLKEAQVVNTADVDIIAAVHMLEAAGLLAAGRAQEILNG